MRKGMSSRNAMPTIIDNFLETTFGVFLDSRRVTEKGDVCSFTGMGTMRGKFMVKDEDYPQFLDLLHEYLFTQQPQQPQQGGFRPQRAPQKGGNMNQPEITNEIFIQ